MVLAVAGQHLRHGCRVQAPAVRQQPGGTGQALAQYLPTERLLLARTEDRDEVEAQAQTQHRVVTPLARLLQQRTDRVPLPAAVPRGPDPPVDRHTAQNDAAYGRAARGQDASSE